MKSTLPLSPVLILPNSESPEMTPSSHSMLLGQQMAGLRYRLSPRRALECTQTIGLSAVQDWPWQNWHADLQVLLLAQGFGAFRNCW